MQAFLVMSHAPTISIILNTTETQYTSAITRIDTYDMPPKTYDTSNLQCPTPHEIVFNGGLPPKASKPTIILSA